jgi:hypothetical protein
MRTGWDRQFTQGEVFDEIGELPLDLGAPRR